MPVIGPKIRAVIFVTAPVAERCAALARVIGPVGPRCTGSRSSTVSSTSSRSQSVLSVSVPRCIVRRAAVARSPLAEPLGRRRRLRRRPMRMVGCWSTASRICPSRTVAIVGMGVSRSRFTPGSSPRVHRWWSSSTTLFVSCSVTTTASTRLTTVTPRPLPPDCRGSVQRTSRALTDAAAILSSADAERVDTYLTAMPIHDPDAKPLDRVLKACRPARVPSPTLLRPSSACPAWFLRRRSIADRLPVGTERHAATGFPPPAFVAVLGSVAWTAHGWVPAPIALRMRRRSSSRLLPSVRRPSGLSSLPAYRSCRVAASRFPLSRLRSRRLC